jgi:aminopeptidase N
VDTLRPRLAVTDGHYESVAIEQSSPTVERPHRIAIALYDGGQRRAAVEVDLAGGVTPVPALSGHPTADLLLLNDGDLTYAKVRLDDTGWARLPMLLPTMDDATARALLWGAVWDAVRDAERPAADYLTLMATALPAERSVVVLAQVLHTAQDVADRLAPESTRPEALRVIAATSARILDTATAGSSHQLAATRALVSSTVDVERLRGWLAGHGVPEGLVLDADLRWQVLQRLVVLGAADPADIEAELARDRTAGGQEWAARCRASIPSAEAKARAWQLITTDLSVSNPGRHLSGLLAA